MNLDEFGVFKECVIVGGSAVIAPVWHWYSVDYRALVLLTRE